MHFLKTFLHKLDSWLFQETSGVENMDRTVWHKKPLSVFLLYLFVCLLAYWNWPSPISLPPGYAVTALAVVAAVMTVLGEMKGKEKVAWILVLFGFLWVELTSVKVERKAQEDIQKEARAEQLEHFGEIGSRIQASIEKSDTNFNLTMGKTNQVLRNITGGDSFAYVSPQNFSGDQFPGVVWNNGEQALVGLTLTIAHTSDPVQVWGAAFFNPIFIGTVGPHEHASIPGFIFQPRADAKSGQDNYWIMLSAQNGTAQQSLYFRRNRLHPQLWAYSFQVVRQHNAEKPQKEKMLMKIDNTPRKGSSQELLLFRAWSDDMEAAASQKR
jgi:hypothetical protein